MDNRPRFLWRRLSVSVVVVLAVALGSAASALAATGPSASKVFYACVAGRFKTLNLTTADATCPGGQMKIAFGSAESGAPGATGPKGATGTRGPKGETGPKGATGPEGKAGATGPEGKTGATGAEGKQGPEGQQGPPGTGSGSAGPEGKAGPAGPAGPIGPPGLDGPIGPIGLQGIPGPAGPVGPQGEPGASGVIAYAASSGQPATVTTLAGGLEGEAAVLPLDGVGAGSAPFTSGGIDLTGGPGQTVPAQLFPTDQTITSLSMFASTTQPLTLVGTAIQVGAQLYTAQPFSNTFTPVPGTFVIGAPVFTGVLAIGSTTSGFSTGLSIPVTAGTRGVIVFTARAAGLTLVNTLPMYFSASMSAA